MGLWSFNWSSANYICINSFSSPSPNLHWKFPRTCNKTKGFDFFLFDSSEVWQDESSFAWTKVLKMFAEKNMGFLCCGAERAYERLLRRRKKLMSGCLDSSRRKSPESNLLRFSQSLLNYFPKVICFWRLCRTQCVQQAWTSKLSTFGAACIELRLHLSGGLDSQSTASHRTKEKFSNKKFNTGAMHGYQWNAKGFVTGVFFHSFKFLAFQQPSLQLMTHQAKIQRWCTDKNGFRRTKVQFVLQQIRPVKLSYCHVYCISWYCMPYYVWYSMI